MGAEIVECEMLKILKPSETAGGAMILCVSATICLDFRLSNSPVPHSHQLL